MDVPLYVILGYNGLLGNAFYQKLSGHIVDYRVLCFEHSHVDISYKSQVREILSYIRPTVVINCAGISSVYICEKERSEAFEANSVGPKILAEECKRIQAKLVHFSSCQVFSGNKNICHTERQNTVPVNFLGKSKLEGEKAIQLTLKDHLIIRPGWMFNYEGPNFLVDWLDRLDRGLTISVPDDVYGSPSFVLDVVRWTFELINRDAKGVFHVANSESATWESLAKTVCDLANKKRSIEVIGGLKLMNVPLGPKYSVLSCHKLQVATGQAVRPWTTALKQCLFHAGRFKP